MRLALIGFLAVCVILSAYTIYWLDHPPLVSDGTGRTMDKRVVLVEVGNRSHVAKIQLKEVLVNDRSRPAKAMVEESNWQQGFIVSDHFDGEEEAKYRFKDLDEVSLQTASDSLGIQAKVDKGIDSKDIKTYAILVSDDETIEKVTLKYRYLWFTYEKTVIVK